MHIDIFGMAKTVIYTKLVTAPFQTAQILPHNLNPELFFIRRSVWHPDAA